MNEFGQSEIATERLRKHHVPTPDEPFVRVEEFALTYNGYERSGDFDRCSERAAATQRAWDTTGEFPSDVDELRNALFFAQRAYRHVMQPIGIDGETYPTDDDLVEGQRWLRQLAEAIRDLAPA